jgi:hypothetical protein
MREIARPELAARGLYIVIRPQAPAPALPKMKDE